MAILVVYSNNGRFENQRIADLEYFRNKIQKPERAHMAEHDAVGVVAQVLNQPHRIRLSKEEAILLNVW